MGRRLLLILGMMLLASPAALVARGQGDGQQAPDPAAAPPAPVAAPVPSLGDIPLLDGSASVSEPAQGKAPLRPPAKAADPAVKRTDGSAQAQSQPGAASAATSAAPPAATSPAENRPAPQRDSGPTPPAPDGSANPPGFSGFPADRLPLGKQSVAVTVDVQAPPSMNLLQPAALRLIVRNTGPSEAMNVRVYDELPEGLEYLSSQPEARRAGESLLTWPIGSLPAGSEKVIVVQVKPVKTGAYDHGATVTFQSGSRARTQVFRPRLKVEQTVSAAKVLKGQSVEFKVVVANIGDGPARNVTIQAKLSPGLRQGSTKPGDEETVYVATIPELAQGQQEELDPLVVDAIQGGDQSCTVTASSPDVIPASEEDRADVRSIKTVTVVEPKLTLTVTGPEKRFTDTVAAYEIKVENPGTAPARRVRVVATLPVSGRLIAVPKGAQYDSTTRRLKWALEQLEPGKPQQFGFEVRMGGVGFYEVAAEARGEGALQARHLCRTDVAGMPDVDLVVSERRRVVDVGDRTTFQIRLRNYGTKEASRIQLTAKLSKNLDVKEYAGPSDQPAQFSDNGAGDFVFPLIETLGPGKEILLGITVQVTSDEPKLATCRVKVLHDDLDPSEAFEDMAGIKVMPTRRAAPSRP